MTKFHDVESFTDISQAKELIHKWNQRFDNHQGIRWGITLKSDNRVIGSCGFHGWVKNHFKAEIGYELAPEFWRKGYVTEAVEKVTAFGFEHFELNRILAFVVPGNTDSRRVLEKVGFTEEALLKEHYYWRNRFVDTVVYALLKNDHRGRDHGKL